MAPKDKIQNALKQSTRYFETYEEREQAFRKSVFSLIPRKYLGPKVFWADFGQISRDGFSQLKENRIAYISSNQESNGEWRRIDIELDAAKKRKLKIRAKRGYYAEEDNP